MDVQEGGKQAQEEASTAVCDHQQHQQQQHELSSHAAAVADAAADAHSGAGDTPACEPRCDGGGGGGGDAAAATAHQPQDATAKQPQDVSAGLLKSVLSLAASKRNNLHLLAQDTLAAAAGCVVLLLHLPSLQQRYLPSSNGCGVAALAVAPDRRTLAVAEQGRSGRAPPNICVYRYPELDLVATLRGGTERSYAALAFSRAALHSDAASATGAGSSTGSTGSTGRTGSGGSGGGSRLASVGCAPDFTLTLWDWAAGAALLRCKAFSQDVYGVGFCPHSPGRLVSCGTGHIRFWSMASTFTGLKLQGALGRFGACELSDVAAWLELPDGKVLSGSEAGQLLLWEGGLIRAALNRRGGLPCHAGGVDVLLHDGPSNYVLSAGADGCVRLWEAARLQDAQPPEDSSGSGSGSGSSGGGVVVEVKPAVTVPLLPPGAGSSAGGGVTGLVWADRRTWLVQTAAGALLQVALPLNLLDASGYSSTQLLALQAGGVVGCATCPDRHVAILAAAGGTLTALDYRSGAVLQQQRFAARISSMAVLQPQQHGGLCAAAATARAGADVGRWRPTVVLGHADGSVRVLVRCSDGWLLAHAARPHKARVACLAVSSDSQRLASVAADGSVFLFQLLRHGAEEQGRLGQHTAVRALQPLLSCQLPAAAVAGDGSGGPSCCCWSADGGRLLVGCATGVAVELQLPQEAASLDASSTYQQHVQHRAFAARLPQRQQQRAPQPQPAAAAEGAAAPKEAAAGSRGAAAAGESGASGDAPPPAPPAPAPQQEPALPPAGPHQQQGAPCVLPITRVSYTQQPGGGSDDLLLWLGGAGAGQVLQCSWASGAAAYAAAASTASSSASGAVTALGSSWSGRFRLTGTADGRVVVEAGSCSDCARATRTWEGSLHDAGHGAVRGLALAFDDSCLLSGAADGTLLLLANPLQQPGRPAAGEAGAAVNAGLPTLAAAAAAAAAAGDGAPQGAQTSELPEGGGLTLEEAKRAAQRDQQAATASAARQGLVAAVAALRDELAALLAHNAAQPLAAQVPQEALQLDAGLAALVGREREARLAAVRAQVAHDCEVAALRLAKLQAHFDASLGEHVVVVHALGSEACAGSRQQRGAGGVAALSAGVVGASVRGTVSTFRPPELPREALASLAEAEHEEAAAEQQQLEARQQQLQQQQQQQQQRAGGRRPTRTLGRTSHSLRARAVQGGSFSESRCAGGGDSGAVSADADADAHGPAAAAAPSAASRAEAWRAAKRARAAAWAAFEASAPGQGGGRGDEGSAGDAAALAQAAASVGDHKLKSDPAYLPPEDQRWTPARKRRQMLALSRQLAASRASHNEAVLSLRERKRRLLARLNGMAQRLREVDGALAAAPPGAGTPAPPAQLLSMRAEEEPEAQLMHVSEAQLAQHAAAKSAAADKAAGRGAFCGFAAAAAAPAAGGVSCAASLSPPTSPGKQAACQAGGGTAAAAPAAAAAAAAAAALSPPTSGGSAAPLSGVQALRLQVEQQQLRGAMATLVAAFNADLSALRCAQLELAVGMKAAEGRLLLLLRELGVLQEAAARERVLDAKRDAKLAEAAGLAAKLAELDDAAADKRTEGEAAAARKAAVAGELEVLLTGAAASGGGAGGGGGGAKSSSGSGGGGGGGGAGAQALGAHEGHREALAKIFHARVKRAKRRSAGKRGPGAGSDAGSGGGSDDDDDYEGDDDDDLDGSGSDASACDEVCPPGCDPALFDAVLLLRERRLDEEQAAAEVARALEALGRERALLAKRQRQVEGALAAINQEVLEFQVEKQARLNQLPAVVSLRRHQLAASPAATAAPSAGASSAAGGGGVTPHADAAGSGSGAGCARPGLPQPDLSEVLVFDAQQLARLQRRLQELDDERDALRTQQKELHRQHKQLLEERGSKAGRLAELEARCRDVQLLKFGQVIDTGLLEGVGLPNSSADELRDALKAQSASAARELAEWDAALAAKRREKLGAVRDNTAALDTLTQLSRAQRALQASVLAGRAELSRDPLDARRAAAAERDALVGRVAAQAGVLEGLQAQLAAMRRKGGRVAAPASSTGMSAAAAVVAARGAGGAGAGW